VTVAFKTMEGFLLSLKTYKFIPDARQKKYLREP
jgi:hypothetical protein